MNFRLFIFLFLLGLLSCKKADINPIYNLNGGIIYVVGHGGAGFQSAFNEMPENSLSSITKAIEVYNADGVEVDVQFTKDLNLVLYHDDKLEISTNGNGFIYEYNLEELNQFKYDRDFYPNLFLDEQIVTLETVLQKFSQRNIKPQLHLDLRTWLYNNHQYSFEDFIELYTTNIVQLISKYNYQEYTYISSGSIEALLAIQEIDANLKLMVETNDVNGMLPLIKQNNWYGIVAQNENITKQKIDFAHKNNIRVALFNVKTQNNIVNAVNKHPDFILTDNIVKLQQILYE
jgi:glycerophosphoryl diester phosphodiesterase